MSTSDEGIPPEMLRGCRPVDPYFEPDENLYRRCVGAEVQGDRLFADLIRFYPDWSVNRQKYSEPEHVLLPNYRDCGIAAFRMVDVPTRLVSEGGAEFTFGVAHVPLEANYAHSEVRTYRDGTHLTGPRAPKIPATVKLQFRMMLSQRARIIRRPRGEG